MPIITRKIELHFCKEGLTDEEYDAQWNFLRQIDTTLYLVANRFSTYCFYYDRYESLLQAQLPEYWQLKEQKNASRKYNLSEEDIAQLAARLKELNSELKRERKKRLTKDDIVAIYRLSTREFDQVIPSDIRNNFKKTITDNYKANGFEIQNGERALNTYKKGMPIPFSVKKTEPFIVSDDKQIILKWFNGIKFVLYFGKDKSHNRVIVERLIESAMQGYAKGEDYVVSNSAIQLVEKNGKTKIFLLLSLDIPVQKRTLDKDFVLGIDLGINFPIYMATNRDSYLRQHIGNRESFLNERMVFQRRFKELQRLQCTQGGRGRKYKLAPLDKLKQKERNWVHTKNHIFSREVIKYALKIGVGTIHLELLKNFGRGKSGEVLEEKAFILRNWSYFELQTMIENKAKVEGIEVKYIKPAFTSQICSYCGERGERTEQAVFHCLNPECIAGSLTIGAICSYLEFATCSCCQCLVFLE